MLVVSWCGRPTAKCAWIELGVGSLCGRASAESETSKEEEDAAQPDLAKMIRLTMEAIEVEMGHKQEGEETNGEEGTEGVEDQQPRRGSECLV